MDSILENEYLGSFIDGNFVCDTTEKIFICKSVVNEKKWLKLCSASDKQIKKAIQSASKTFIEFKKTNPYHRKNILDNAAKIIHQNKELIARVITSEMGKTYRESIAEIEYAINYFYWFASEAIKKTGYSIPATHSNERLSVTFEPVGVCGVITPWNFPIAMAARKIAPAIAAGCTVIVKPAVETPVTMLLVAEAFRRAKLTSGALQILIGDEKKIGQSFVESEYIRKISFTGSTEVGKFLYKKLASNLKVASLELGGNAPLIVTDEIDLNLTVDEIIKAKLRNLGQSCIAANRIFIHKKIKKRLLANLVLKVKKLKIGNPFLKDIHLTKILHPKSIIKMQNHIEDALHKGAKILLKGKTFSQPHIINHCNDKMQLFNEETFGPLFAIFEFEDDKKVLELANQIRYGLASYVFTNNLKRAYFFKENLQYGMVGLNNGSFNSHQLPFGGVKDSGFGREGGPTGILEYMTEKAVSLKL
jgi:succinate-semialdehyde dehydrogenase / glutarate-semialdehyde dehydrogenase